MEGKLVDCFYLELYFNKSVLEEVYTLYLNKGSNTSVVTLLSSASSHSWFKILNNEVHIMQNRRYIKIK